MVRQVLIRCYLSYCCTTCAVQMICTIFCIIQIQITFIQILCPVIRVCLPGRSCFLCRSNINSGPTEEFISIAGRSSRDVNTYVNYCIIVLNIGIFTDILIPVNMSRCRLLSRDILSSQPNRILLGIAGRCRSRKIFYLCVRFQNCKCVAGKYGSLGICPSTIDPFLNDPVTKYLIGITGLRSRACGCLRSVNIIIRIGRSACATVRIVFDYDTGSTFQRRMPLRIDVQLRGNPETIFSWSTFVTVIIPSSEIGVVVRPDQLTVIIISIRHIDGLIVRSRDVGRIDGIGFSVKHLCEFRIKIPAIKFPTCQISTGRLTDVAAFTDTESHCLICSTPVDIAGCSIRVIHVKEYTVLLLTPFCIDSNTAFRHFAECIWLSASTINKPSFKYISRRSVCRIRLVVVIGGNIRSVRKIICGTDLSHICFC